MRTFLLTGTKTNGRGKRSRKMWHEFNQVVALPKSTSFGARAIGKTLIKETGCSFLSRGMIPEE
jgi:hypothetical protein